MNVRWQRGAAGLWLAAAVAASAQAPDLGGLVRSLVQEERAPARPAPLEGATLKAALPERLGGMNRESLSEAATTVPGLAVTSAEALYREGRQGRIRVKLTDIAGLNEMAAAARYAWTAGSVDRQDEDGHERTVSFRGRPGFEQVRSRYRTAHLAVLFRGRLMVELEGREVDLARVRAALDELDPDRLDRLAGPGRPAAP